MQNNARIDADKNTATTFVNAAKIYITDKNLTTDADVQAVDLSALATAKLIESATVATQTTKNNFVLTVGGTASEPTFNRQHRPNLSSARRKIYKTIIKPTVNLGLTFFLFGI